MVRRKHVIIGLATIAISYVALLVTYFLLPSNIYVLTPPTGRVIDQRTQAPVADVSVLAIWQMQGGVGMVTSWIDPLYVAQTETDSEGNFRIKVPSFVLYRTHAWNTALSDPQPVVFFLKTDYAPAAVTNRSVPIIESFLGNKNLISVPVALGDDGDGLVTLKRFTSRGVQLDVYEEGLLDSLRSLLFPFVMSCEISTIEAFYETFISVIRTTDKARIEPYSAMTKHKTCGDRNYEYF